MIVESLQLSVLSVNDIIQIQVKWTLPALPLVWWFAGGRSASSELDSTIVGAHAVSFVSSQESGESEILLECPSSLVSLLSYIVFIARDPS